VRVIRLPCTGRIDFMMVMKAFSRGSDGVIVSGCHPNDCHYTSGNYHARRRWMVFRDLLVGLGGRRRQVGRVGQSGHRHSPRARPLQRDSTTRRRGS
jgi:coenzyme F420-reducing hydrogenase delta subunit